MIDWKKIEEHPKNADEIALNQNRPDMLLWHPIYGLGLGVVWHWPDGECYAYARGYHGISFPYYAEVNPPEIAS